MMSTCFHQLEPSTVQGYRWHCVKCDKLLKIKSGSVTSYRAKPMKIETDEIISVLHDAHRYCMEGAEYQGEPLEIAASIRSLIGQLGARWEWINGTDIEITAKPIRSWRSLERL